MVEATLGLPSSSQLIGPGSTHRSPRAGILIINIPKPEL